MTDDLRFLSIGELAAITGRSPRTIRRWFRQGLLPRRRLGCITGCFASDLVAAAEVTSVAADPADDDLQ